jgi:NADH dehydrogenase [ubiquinone] 1 alpha subcomplex assembly factor 3
MNGFRINTGVLFIGPVAIFPRTVFQWDVNSIHDINEESLSLFWLIEPKIDILVIGVGDRGLELDPKIRVFMAKKGVTCEVLSTPEAVATFNFMNNDHRNVACALIPPSKVRMEQEDIFMVHANNEFKDMKLLEK